MCAPATSLPEVKGDELPALANHIQPGRPTAHFLLRDLSWFFLLFSPVPPPSFALSLSLSLSLSSSLSLVALIWFYFSVDRTAHCDSGMVSFSWQKVTSSSVRGGWDGWEGGGRKIGGGVERWRESRCQRRNERQEMTVHKCPGADAQ